MKRFLSILLVAAMLIGVVGCSSTSNTQAPASEEGLFKPGTYEGEGKGLNGPIKVSVTVDADKILSIEIKEHKETAGISDPALTKLPEEIITQQTVALDAVAGCTFSSKGVLEAVKAALLSAGASEADITKAPTAKEASNENFEKSADVIIVGGGGAGLSAAVSAAKNGGSVILVEKMSVLGGNTILAGGAMNYSDQELEANLPMTDGLKENVLKVINTEPKNDEMAELQTALQKEYDEYLASGATGQFDSVNLHILQTYIDGDYLGNLELIKTLCTEAVVTGDWLQELGVKWEDKTVLKVGALWPRCHMAQGYTSGKAYRWFSWR